MKQYFKLQYILALISLLAMSCQPADDYGHSHDESDGHSHAGQEYPAEVYTIWTDQTELFVEFPALTVGQTSRFAAHFTVLEGHQPVNNGSVTVSLVQGSKGIRHKVDAPSSPGIFTPALQPKEAGSGQLIFELQTADFTDRIILDSVRVFASAEEAGQALSGEGEEGNVISFLKEQAWKMEFQTEPVIEKEIYQVIRTSGIWNAAPSDHRTLVAPASGQVRFSRGTLTKGSSVSKGQVLMTVSSNALTTDNLDAEIQKAKADFEQAKSEYERKKILSESGIIPRAEMEKVEKNYLVAKTQFETLSSGYSAAGKNVVVPFNGYITSIAAANGGFVEQGAALVTITSQRSSLLEVRVSPAHFSVLNNIQNVWYQPAAGVWSSLNDKGGNILSVGREVDTGQPLLSVFARVNEGVEMPKGSFTEAHLAVGDPVESTVVPAASLLEDYGNYSVIVQLSGESFERRNVTIGNQNGDEVEVLQGLHPGEIVVTKGAYQVKMASMSGQAPAHGHVH